MKRKKTPPVIVRLRSAMTRATYKHGAGSSEKKNNKPKPVTLPKVQLRDIE